MQFRAFCFPVCYLKPQRLKYIKLKFYLLFYMGVKLGFSDQGKNRNRGVWERILRRIFGPKRDEMTRGWRNLHNEELRNLHSSPNIIRIIISRRMGWVGHVARIWIRTAYRILVGKPEGKRSPVRQRRRWEDNIKIYHREIGWEGVDWIQVGRDRNQWQALVNKVMNLWFL
jgi:hypothetical protein